MITSYYGDDDMGLPANVFHAVHVNPTVDPQVLIDLSPNSADALAACSPDTNKIAVTYKNSGDNKLYLLPCPDFNLGTVTPDSPVEVATLDAGGNYLAMCALTTSSVFIIYWSTSDTLLGVVVSDIWGTPSVESPITLQAAFSGDSIDWISCYTESSTKVVFGYRHSDGSTSLAEYKVNTVSGIGTTNTVGTALASGTTFAATNGLGSIARLTSDRCIVAYTTGQLGSADFEYAVVDGVSDDTLAEIATQAASANFRYASTIIATAADRAIIVGTNTTVGVYAAQVLSGLDGGTITLTNRNMTMGNNTQTPGVLTDDGRVAFGIGGTNFGGVAAIDDIDSGETPHVVNIGSLNAKDAGLAWSTAQAMVKYAANRVASIVSDSGDILATRFQ